MDALRRLAAISLADLRQRTRQPRFWWVLALLVAGAWLCLPEAGSSNGMRVTVGEGRGWYSSAWVGMVMALCASTLLTLFGFYAARGSIAQDIDSRGWEVLMATPMTRAGYLVAKFMGLMAVFALYIGAMALTGLVGQWVRGEVVVFAPWELLKPLLLLTLPAMAVTAACIVWFDLLPWLRATAGNVLYFFVWIALLVVGPAGMSEGDLAQPAPDAPTVLLTDVPGITVMRTDILPVVAATRPDLVSNNFQIGGSGEDDPSARFPWDAWHPDANAVLSRVALLLLALGLVVAATPLVNWAASRPRNRVDAASQAGWRLRWLDLVLKPLEGVAFGRLVAAELRLALRPRGAWWWVFALGALGAQFGAPGEGRHAAWLVALALGLPYFARALLRDDECGTADLLASGERRRGQLRAARLTAASLLALGLSLPSLIVSPEHAFAVAAAALSVAACGFGLARLTGNARTAELLYVLGAYLALNGAPVFSPFVHPQATVLWHGAAAVVAVLVVLIGGRR
ncbi:ABC transporter permease subunit [Silanimonas sp.]|jgi:hypothetical protein|uniref:ABC transporter permease subunit n=1 Tax=Silanimonas sp. TaxID=1929290 RepID=UPI0037C5F377